MQNNETRLRYISNSFFNGTLNHYAVNLFLCSFKIENKQVALLKLICFNNRQLKTIEDAITYIISNDFGTYYDFEIQSTQDSNDLWIIYFDNVHPKLLLAQL
jgi:hypothetical protein